MPMPVSPDPEIKICGAHACSAVAQRRPEDVRRVYITEALMPSFGGFLRWCAAQRLAYHVVDETELERITQSVHHGGVAFIVRQPPPPTLGSLLHRVRGEDPSTPRLLIYLDNVQNPHNLGAIVRVAAHFGADGVLIAGEGTGMSTAMTRTAEGGAEFIDVVPVALGARPLQAVRSAGFTLVATTSHGQHSLYGEGLPPRVVIMLGSESHGLAPSVSALADLTITIPGSGQVESLNVACAAAVLLAEHWRGHRAEPPSGRPELGRSTATEPAPDHDKPRSDRDEPRSDRDKPRQRRPSSPAKTQESRGDGPGERPRRSSPERSPAGKEGHAAAGSKPGRSPAKGGKHGLPAQQRRKPGKSKAGDSRPKGGAGKPSGKSSGKPSGKSSGKPSGKSSGKARGRPGRGSST